MLLCNTSYITLHDRDAALQTLCSMQHRLNMISTALLEAVCLLQKLGEQNKQRIKDHTRSYGKPL